MTHYIAHRINTVEELKQVPREYGVEIDLRDSPDGKIHIAHDPFSTGEDFEDYLRNYQHGTLVLNIKSERIEFRVLELIGKYSIKNYFFLDSSFPMIYLLTKQNENRVAIRYSEFEGMDTLKSMRGKLDWVWVDCFSKLPLNTEIFNELKSMGYKLCLVSPELQGRPEDLFIYKKYLSENDIIFDSICTKMHNVNNWKRDGCDQD